MAVHSILDAFLKVVKVFKKYVYLKETSSYYILALFTLLTHCFRSFDAVPYLMVTGPYGSG